MEYIPDKRLYSAVMFFLSMCPNLETAYDYKINTAANYYHVSPDDVLKIVKKELWDRARNKAKEDPDRWHTIFNHSAPQIFGTGFMEDYVFICPRCGSHYSFNIHDDYNTDIMFVSQCRKCGFADNYQRTFIRKELYEKLRKEGR